MAENSNRTMSATRTKTSAADEAPASIPQTPPPGIGYGHPEYQFVQSIMEMQKSLGEINSSIKTLSTSVDSVKGKVDDLVKWKNMILGGAIVTGVFISFVIFTVSKASDYLTIKTPPAQVIPPVQLPPPVQETPHAPKSFKH